MLVSVDAVLVSAGFAGKGASPPTGDPGAGCAAGVLCAPLPEPGLDGACAAGVFAGVVLDADPLDWAQAPKASANANPDRTANLKPVRSVALMTSPPPCWVSCAHGPASLYVLDASIRSFGNN
jgi:hypothetical protein